MKLPILLLIISLCFSARAFTKTLEEKDLVGVWYPSKAGQQVKGATRYKLVVEKNMKATYTEFGKAQGSPNVMECSYKPSNNQSTVFVFYCLHDDTHLITLSLAGWSISSGYKQLFGFEYWLTFPSPGNIYNGIPVTLSSDGT